MKRSLLLVTMSMLAVLTTSCGNNTNESPKATASTPSPPTQEGQQWVTASGASAQIHQLTEMNTEQLRALPRDTTVVVMPGAYKGEHGPYLPNVDTFRNERLARELANAIAQRPGWHVVVFPFIPLGSDGANVIGGKFSFSGTFVVRAATLRAVFMDLAGDLGEQGFRWVFVVHNTGSAFHVQALDQAGDYFHDTYGGHMVNLTGLLVGSELDGIFNQWTTEAERNEDGYSFHAGMRETSEALYLRPDLVNPAYKQAPALTARNMADFVELAKKKDWPGYFGSPRLATASLGERALKEYSARINKLALEILDGRDYHQMPRIADEESLKAQPPEILRHHQELAKKQEDWLKRQDQFDERPPR